MKVTVRLAGKTVYRKKKRKTSFEMDDMDDVVADLQVMKIKQWLEKMKDKNED